MAKSRRGGKAAAKPKIEPKNEPKMDESSEESEKESQHVDETYVVTGLNGLKEQKSTAPSSVPDVKVSIEKCDAIIVKHKTSENEDSSMESEGEDEELEVSAGKEDLSDEESSPIKAVKEAVNDFASADESDLNDSSDAEEEEEEEEEAPEPPPGKSNNNATFVRQPIATKKPKKGAKTEQEKASPEAVSGNSKYAPVKATGSSRNPGRVASVAEKKKLASASLKVSSKEAASGSKKTDSKTKISVPKAKEGGNKKAVKVKPISEVKKDIIIDLLMDGLSKHDERKGVSVPTIKKYVVENDVKERNWSQLQSRVKKALDSALMEGKILRPKGNEHMNGMVGRFKVNKNYRTKKVSKRGANSSDLETSPKKEVVTSKPSKSSATSTKAKKRSPDQEEKVPPKETKGKAVKGPKGRPKIFSDTESDEDFEKPLSFKAPPASKVPRRKSKSGGEFVKANSKGAPKPKSMKRSHSVESIPTATKGRPKSKK